MMFALVEKRRLYFAISAVLILTGLLSMIYSLIATGSPVQVSIDFTGGALLEVAFERAVPLEDLRATLQEAGLDDVSAQTIGDDKQVVIRTKEIGVAQKEALLDELRQTYGPVTERRFESVGPSIGRETTRAALLALLAASVAILAFIAFAFRRVPNSLRYGVCAIAKMLHDVLFLLGFTSLMGVLFGWEVDALILTAVFTVIGFSLQDVIVVFDRIRENIPRRRGEDYETIVNRSLLETLHRSLTTQLNAIFVMIAIILFGGATTRNFMVTMLVGMVMGTFSSLFFAVPLLVVWEKDEWGSIFRRARASA
ncbi:MAG: protein translocase subunit SecF [Anaerolineae bacterium]